MGNPKRLMALIDDHTTFRLAEQVTQNRPTKQKKLMAVLSD